MPLAALVLALAPAPVTHSATAEPTCRIDYPSPAAALSALRDKPGVTFREENDWIVARDNTEQVLWSITTQANPVHSSAVKRCFYEHDGKLKVQTKIICSAEKSACELMVQQFKELDESLAAKMRQ